MKIISLICSLLLSLTAFAQDNTIKGKILDASNNDAPITFAKVLIKETNQKVTTDFRGNYFFENLPAGEYTLEFSFLGFKTLTKNITIKAAELLELDANLKQLSLLGDTQVAMLTSTD